MVMHDETRRLLAQDQVPTPDPVQVQRELHAHLVTRGQQLAQDMDLGHVEDQDLRRLGELAIIGEYPDLHPDLALYLDMIATKIEASTHPTWAERYALHQGHRHAINETCTETDKTPDRSTSVRPDLDRLGSADAIDQGQGERPAREQPKIKQSKHLRDHPDEEWS
jgi:hypothetical protein